AAIMCTCVLSACSSKDDGAEVDTSSAAQSQTESASDAQTASEPSADTKYGDAEVYTNADGKDAAKTESGVEVELSGDNLQKLYGEYQKVAGTGSDKEKELLDQIQLILEASQSVLEVQQ
ncbi:MAG: hypothetical protein IKV73_03525, partial [Clostridia bacterium]|nr:hypothetical protein [Clostridia bacterium]